MVYRLILPSWATDSRPKALEGQFTDELIQAKNAEGYNIYFLPNYPSLYEKGVTVDGTHIDTFEYVFVDMDLKEGVWNKDSFIDSIVESGLEPTRIVDSGNGIHVYWAVADLDALSFLRLQRRLCRRFKTDEAVSKIYQLMRLPGTMNTKAEGDYKHCESVFESTRVYMSDELDRALSPISHSDEEYCQRHFNKTYRIGQEDIKIDQEIPVKFKKLLRDSQNVRDIWAGNVEDRSTADFHLGHIMSKSGFTRGEALSVLVNTNKALARAPIHRISYAMGIVEKVRIFAETPDKGKLELSSTVREILERHGDQIKGTRFSCWKYLDNTANGFRLGQVIGLVAGSGVGKTAMALNMFEGFVQNNPDYEHFFVPLEQPTNEIADRWRTMCGDSTSRYDKVHLLSNYDKDGNFRHLSLDEIKEYLLRFQKETGKKIGCVVIDHIGALRKQGKEGENQSLMEICHSMKAFAVQTNTMLIMQSQAPREKAGIGDLELDKDAAYGTVYFESYCDYLLTIWQPLKRCYKTQGCPTVTAFKFCKIRHKKQGFDVIQEDAPYRLFFEPITEHLRELTEIEEKSFDFYNNVAVNIRKKDRKTDVTPYVSTRPQKETDAKSKDNKNSKRAH